VVEGPAYPCVHRWKLEEAFARGGATRRGGQREGKRARPIPGAQVAPPELGEPAPSRCIRASPQPWR
jgi:hypothetical protein